MLGLISTNCLIILGSNNIRQTHLSMTEVSEHRSMLSEHWRRKCFSLKFCKMKSLDFRICSKPSIVGSRIYYQLSNFQKSLNSTMMALISTPSYGEGPSTTWMSTSRTEWPTKTLSLRAHSTSSPRAIRRSKTSSTSWTRMVMVTSTRMKWKHFTKMKTSERAVPALLLRPRSGSRSWSSLIKMATHWSTTRTSMVHWVVWFSGEPLTLIPYSRREELGSHWSRCDVALTIDFSDKCFLTKSESYYWNN